jgi:vacuolar-type H+-ATPase subunit I/STV1
MLLLGCLLPDDALAFQPHAYSGLYIHQLAHFFLIVSLFFFAVKARQTRLISQRAWKYIIAGTWLLMLWSATTMVGHFLDLHLDEDSLFLPPGEEIPVLRLNGWKEALYYLLKLDHLIAVPAVFLFYRGLKLLREKQAMFSSPGQDRP